MIILNKMIKKLKALFSFNSNTSRAEITMHRLRNMQMSRKTVKA